MNSKLYVGNLSYQTSEGELAELFGNYGDVKSAKIIMDRDTGRSKGFAFVEMESSEQANEAVAGLDGQEAFGRNLRVNIAKERPPMNRGGGNGGGGFRGGNRY